MYVRSSVGYVKCKKSLIKHTFQLFAHSECNLDRIHKNKCTIFFLIRRYTRAVAKQWSDTIKIIHDDCLYDCESSECTV